MRLVPALLALLAFAPPAFAFDDADYLAQDQKITALYRSGDVQNALTQARTLFADAAAAFGPTAPNTFEAGITLSNMLRGVGDDAAALALLEGLHASVTTAFTALAPIRIKVAVAYANTLSDMGQPETALPLHIEAVAAAETLLGPDNDTTLIFSFNLAKTYEVLGYGDEALEIYRRLAASYDRIDGPNTLLQRANIRTQIARTLYEMQRNDEAVTAYRTALPLLTEHWGPGHPRVLAQQLVFAYALWRNGQAAEVETLIQSLYALATLTFGPDSLFHADIAALHALTLTANGPNAPQFAQALSLMERSILVRETQLGPIHPDLGRPMLEYAAMLRDTTRYGEAARFALRAEAAGWGSRDLLIETLVAAANAGQMSDTDAATQLFRIVQQSSSSAAGFASLQLAARFALGNTEDADRFRLITDRAQRQTQLQAQLLDASMRPLTERDPADEDRMRGQIAQNAADKTSAEARLYANHPSIADLIGGGVLTVPEVQAMLGTEGALVVVDFGDHATSPGFAMAMTEAGVGFAILPYTTQDYAAAVADIRAGISLQLGTRAAVALTESSAPAPQTFNFPAASWLYDTTIGQVFAINGKRKHLYLDLRGPLAAVPSQLLVTQPVDDSTTHQTARWLVRDLAVTVLPSVYALKLKGLAQTAQRPPAPMLGFANPVYAETGADLAAQNTALLRNVLTPLPETASELSQVAAAVNAPADAQRLGPMASESALKAAALRDYGILYFATHGLVSGDVVGNAVLGEPALALTAGGGEDGLLTATEITQLHLNADLVVLSACNTAVGDTPGAQALSGLARAFTYAGARSLLVSHWPVESRSAVRMMTDIFARRAATPGLDLAEAQREAILSMIDTPPNPAWSHPAYWAPFVLVGDPGAP